MNDKKVMEKFAKLPMEIKLKMLSETDKAFIRGYIERALIEQQRTKSSKRTKKAEGFSNKD